MTNSDGLRQSDKNLAMFIDQVTFYCSLRFAEHKSCIEAGCTSCHSDSIMEWLKKEEL